MLHNNSPLFRYTSDSDGNRSISGNGTDHTSTTYDWLGRATSATDQRGVVHSYTYDSAGRLSADTVTDFGRTDQNVSQTVNEIDTSYDDLGRVHQTTSRGLVDNVETVLNQVQYAYDGWGNEIAEWQAVAGAVVTQASPGIPVTPSVQYVYADGAGSTGVAQYVRLTDVIYPNGRDVSYGYGTAGAIDDIMSRLATISDSSGTLAAYTYLGAGTVASEDFTQPQVKLDYSANNFAALDRFGRVVDQVFKQYGGTPSVLDEYTYTYDKSGNRTARTNALDSALSEMYQYDDLDRLREWSVDGVQQKTWSLDSLGNNLAAGTYSAANEETPTTGSSGYDLAGNMTTLQSGDAAKYDAWNRLVEVDDGSTIVEKYAYDAANRRIQIYSDFAGNTPGTVTDDYYAGQQMVESDVATGGVRAGGYQFIWSPRYIDALIVRDTLNTAGTRIVTLERTFYLADANFNVTGLVRQNQTTGDWEVAERYTYTPYGVVTVRDALWAPVSGNTSQFSNTTLYTGREYSFLTGLYNYRARSYDPVLQRFINRDQTATASGGSLYQYAECSPLQESDPSGQLSLQLSPPVYRGLGVADPWVATFRLAETEQTGMIIQKVVLDWSVSSCYEAEGKRKILYIGSAPYPDYETADIKKQGSLVYWEMWWVDRQRHYFGTVGKGSVPSVEGDKPPTDTFKVPQPEVPGGKGLKLFVGSFYQSGEVMWVPKAVPKDLDAYGKLFENWTVLGTRPAGVLYFSHEEPKEWKVGKVVASRAWHFSYIYLPHMFALDAKLGSMPEVAGGQHTAGDGWSGTGLSK